MTFLLIDSTLPSLNFGFNKVSYGATCSCISATLKHLILYMTHSCSVILQQPLSNYFRGRVVQAFAPGAGGRRFEHLAVRFGLTRPVCEEPS